MYTTPLHSFQYKVDTENRVNLDTSHDPFEREADKMAQLVNQQSPNYKKILGNKSVSEGMNPKKTGISAIQTKAKGENRQAGSSVEKALGQSKGQGQGLDKNTLGQMNRSFSADFGQVRIHTDQQAIQMNQNLNAHAFTYGNDVYFNAGEFRPDSREGQHLLAHELTHVLQQKGEDNNSGNQLIQKSSKKKCEQLEAFPELVNENVVRAIGQAWERSTGNEKFTSERLESINEERQTAEDTCLADESKKLEDCADLGQVSNEGYESLMGSRFLESAFAAFTDGSVSEINTAEFPWTVPVPPSDGAIALFHTHPPRQSMNEGNISDGDTRVQRWASSRGIRIYIINRKDIQLLGDGAAAGSAEIVATFKHKDLEKCLRD